MEPRRVPRVLPGTCGPGGTSRLSRLNPVNSGVHGVVPGAGTKDPVNDPGYRPVFPVYACLISRSVSSNGLEYPRWIFGTVGTRHATDKLK
jgi:hypothetical protein